MTLSSISLIQFLRHKDARLAPALDLDSSNWQSEEEPNSDFLAQEKEPWESKWSPLEMLGDSATSQENV